MKKKKYDTLVLNKSWIPVYIIDWKRSLSLLYQDHAHGIDSDYVSYNFNDWIEFTNMLPVKNDYRVIKAVNFKIAVPEIIVLTKFNSLPKRHVKFSRENVFTRDGHACAYCGKIFRLNELTLDHVVPKSRGGTNNWDNVVSSCKYCNAKKADRTLAESGMILKFAPKQPSWLDRLNKMAKYPRTKPSWLKFLKTIDLHEKTEEEYKEVL